MKEMCCRVESLSTSICALPYHRLPTYPSLVSDYKHKAEVIRLALETYITVVMEEGVDAVTGCGGSAFTSPVDTDKRGDGGFCPVPFRAICIPPLEDRA